MPRIALVVSLLFALSSLAEKGPEPFVPSESPSETERACAFALDACGELVEAQDAQIESLQIQLEETHEALANTAPEPLLPDWAWFAIGVAAGGAMVYIAK